jgi:hypothetical protein
MVRGGFAQGGPAVNFFILFVGKSFFASSLASDDQSTNSNG